MRSRGALGVLETEPDLGVLRATIGGLDEGEANGEVEEVGAVDCAAFVEVVRLASAGWGACATATKNPRVATALPSAVTTRPMRLCRAMFVIAATPR